MEITKEKNFASVVVYVHNNEKNIEQFLRYIYQEISTNFLRFEIVCVNDASNDKSIDKIKEFSVDICDCVVSVINMGFYHGIEASMNAGVDLAIGDFVFEFDSLIIDYEHTLIMDIYKKAIQGYDIVSASPVNIRSKSSKIFYKIFNKFSEGNYKLSTERFRVLSRRAINRVDSIGKTTPYRKALYASSGLKTYSIAYNNEYSKVFCKNTMLDEDKKSTAIDTLVLFTDIAYRISLSFSMLMILFMICTGLYTVIVYLGQSKPVAGWAPLMGLISVGFFGLFLVLTIVIKYLDIILKLVFKKQKYLISSIDKLK